jgi:hypothetical protein
MQEIALVCAGRIESLVNSHSNKVVNIRSTKMMKKILAKGISPSLLANGSRECAPDNRLREAIDTAAQETD